MANVVEVKTKKDYVCRECVTARAAAYRDKKGSAGLRDARILREYKLSIKDFNELWASQSGKCQICNTGLSLEQYGYSIDHNHDTGEVRGILCNPCNRALGYFKDSPENLKSAISYLERNGDYSTGIINIG